MTTAPRAYYNGRLQLSSDATTTATDWYPTTDCTSRPAHLTRLEESLITLRAEKREKKWRASKKIDRIVLKAEAAQRFAKGMHWK